MLKEVDDIRSALNEIESKYNTMSRWNEKLRDEKCQLVTECNSLREQLAQHTERNGKINDLSFENDQLKKILSDRTEELRQIEACRESAIEERDGLKKQLSEVNRRYDVANVRIATLTYDLSEAKKALAFYENLAAKQAGTSETHVSIPISAMSDVYVLWNRKKAFRYFGMCYSEAKDIIDRSKNKDLGIARLVWVE